MTRSTTTRRKTPAVGVTPHHYLLAGLGAVSLGRKSALRSIDDLIAGTDQLRVRADAAARKAGKRVEKLQKQAEAKIAPVRKQAVALAKQAQATVEHRLAPVLAQFGVKRAPAKRPARVAKRTPRPAAKRAQKRA